MAYIGKKITRLSQIYQYGYTYECPGFIRLVSEYDSWFFCLIYWPKLEYSSVPYIK